MQTYLQYFLSTHKNHPNEVVTLEFDERWTDEDIDVIAANGYIIEFTLEKLKKYGPMLNWVAMSAGGVKVVYDGKRLL